MPNIVVTPPSTIKVQVGNQFSGKVQSIAYGTRTLKSATDLNIGQAQTGDVITYDAANNSFYVTNVANDLLDLDAGFF
jgi:molybdopterin-binding protein